MPDVLRVAAVSINVNTFDYLNKLLITAANLRDTLVLMA